jgi:hypothetical protein
MLISFTPFGFDNHLLTPFLFTNMKDGIPKG